MYKDPCTRKGGNDPYLVKRNLSKGNGDPEIEACGVHSETEGKASLAGISVAKGNVVGGKEWAVWGLLEGLIGHHTVFSAQFHSKEKPPEDSEEMSVMSWFGEYHSGCSIEENENRRQEREGKTQLEGSCNNPGKR